ncbi:MAG: hypothetical protein EG823_02270 [Actinobacteria bacterium]|nr:hypothetical protein [Actinomycetota bacterium]
MERRGPERGRQRALVLACITLAAFLLFSLELYAGRAVLPVFGGSPAVWTTALCFFTAVVFLGYVYGHVLVTRLRPGAALSAHALLIVATLAAAFVAPHDLAALHSESMPPVLNVLLVLAAIVGLPVFLLSTTTPLLSARLAAEGEDPWWLYAVSNAASLLGLLAYPFLIEPRLPLSAQRTSASVALLVLAAGLIAVLGARERTPIPTRTAACAPGPSRRRQAIWLFAASMVAGMLPAVAMHLSTDHMASPLLWIGPLGVYLGSFVVAFSERGRRALPVIERLVPAAAALMWVPFVARLDWPVVVLLPLLLACFGVLAVALHGRLALDRPDEAHLTRFYVLVSAGGLLATGFVALLAPLLFSDVYEYPIMLAGGLLALAMMPRPAADTGAARTPALRGAVARLVPFALVGAALVASIATRSAQSATFVAVLLIIGSQAVAFGATPKRLAAATTLAMVLAMSLFAPKYVERVRTFFGITQVREAASGEAFSEIHGTTLHGLQYRDARRSEPTAYFVRSGPLGDVFADLAEREPDGGDIAVVGLGIGTIAAYERESDSLTYYEIDRGVIALANDERYFTYLSDAPVRPEIVTGDGRLSLAAETRKFDLLVLDAFSSDAVPVHLLTREALGVYRDRLMPGGIIAFQLTNRHFELVGAVASTARSLGLETRTRSYTPPKDEADELSALPSTWLVVGDAETIAAFDALAWEQPAEGPVLTDDYPDVMRLLRAF